VKNVQREVALPDPTKQNGHRKRRQVDARGVDDDREERREEVGVVLGEACLERRSLHLAFGRSVIPGQHVCKIVIQSARRKAALLPAERQTRIGAMAVELASECLFRKILECVKA